MNGWRPILVYHRIAEVPQAQDPLRLCTSPRSLERVLRYLSENGYRFVSLGEAVATLERGGSSERLVCLTFDDGYRDFLTDAFPLLQRFGASATVFPVSDCIGGVNRWDACYGLAPLPLLSSDEVLTLSEQGIEFGSHSLTHPRLTQVDPWQQGREIHGSRKALEDLLGRTV
jgi:peptidoglycan/xylan/chitin deacetylase (PgdA/CDA1 family)